MPVWPVWPVGLFGLFGLFLACLDGHRRSNPQLRENRTEPGCTRSSWSFEAAGFHFRLTIHFCFIWPPLRHLVTSASPERGLCESTTGLDLRSPLWTVSYATANKPSKATRGRRFNCPFSRLRRRPRRRRSQGPVSAPVYGARPHSSRGVPTSHKRSRSARGSSSPR